MPIHTNKSSFTGGEFSPSLWSRIDIAKYSTGARRLRNFFVHPMGGISNRPGTRYMATSKKDDSKVRVIDFQFSTNENLIIEMGDYYCRFHTSDGQLSKSTGTAWAAAQVYSVNDMTYASGNIYRCLQAHTSATLSADITALRWGVDIYGWATGQAYATGTYLAYTNGTAAFAVYYTAQNHTSGTFTVDLAAGKLLSQTIYEIPSPYGENDLAGIDYAQSADTIFIVHPTIKPMELSRIYDTKWTFSEFDFERGPFAHYNEDLTFTMKSSVTSGTGTLTASSAFFNPLHVGGLMQVNHYMEGQSTTAALSSVTTSSSIRCGGTWRIITHGTWKGTIRVEKSEDGGSTWTMLRLFSSDSDFNVDTYGTEIIGEDDSPFLVRVNMTASTSGTCNVDLSCDSYIQKGVHSITSYTSPTVVNIAVQEPLGSTATTTYWAEGAWSDYRGWPKSITFNQDRLVFGGNSSYPQTIWMTESGDYYDFIVQSPITDSDGISVNLPSQKLNAVNGLVPLLQLLVLTSGAEWSLGSTDNNVISPTSVNIKLNSYAGSSGVKPCVIVNRAIYVQHGGSVIRDMGYDLFTDTFSGNNLSIVSGHLFFNHSIVSMAYQKDPDSLVYAVRDDGIMLVMTYMREQEVLAWTWFDTNEGEDLYESVAVIPNSGKSEVWVVVNRGGQRYIEKFENRMSSEMPKDQFFVDCGVTYDVSSAADPYVQLLMHNDTSAFLDEKSNVVTNNGATFNTVDEKFGAGCAEFDGASHYLSVADSATFSSGTGSFSFEMQVAFDRLGQVEFLMGQIASTTSYCVFFKDEFDKIGMTFCVGGVNVGDYITTNPYVFSTNSMNHILWERSGATAYIMINGVSQALTEITAFSTNDLGNIASALTIGATP